MGVSGQVITVKVVFWSQYIRGTAGEDTSCLVKSTAVFDFSKAGLAGVFWKTLCIKINSFVLSLLVGGGDFPLVVVHEHQNRCLSNI